MNISLWLDDERKPPSYSDSGILWTWAKNYEEAILHLQAGAVVFASLDHDLTGEHYSAYFKACDEGTDLDTSHCHGKTGYDVLRWMEEHGVWPKDGVRIHTMNLLRKPVMLAIVEKHYGRNFQAQYSLGAVAHEIQC